MRFDVKLKVCVKKECSYSQILASRVHQVHLINRQPSAGFFTRAATQKKRTYNEFRFKEKNDDSQATRLIPIRFHNVSRWV